MLNQTIAQPIVTSSHRTNSQALLPQLKSGQLLIVAPNSQGVLILCKPHYAEFVGAGSAVGGVLDLECCRVIPVGTVSLTYSECWWDRHQAYLARSRWVALTQKATIAQAPLRRALIILSALAKQLGWAVVAEISNDLIANLVGVLPHTVEMARSLVLVPGNHVTRSSSATEHNHASLAFFR